MSRKLQIVAGDKVAYSTLWLRSVGAFTGDLGHARGVVRELEHVSESLTLAVIDWNLRGIPERVNVVNLTKIRQNGVIL